MGKKKNQVKKNVPLTETQKYKQAVKDMLADADHNLLPKFKRYA